MKRLWLLVIVIIVLCCTMIALTYINPDIKKYATDVAGAKHWPIWLVGLFAPLAYFFQRIGGWIKTVGSNTGIAQENTQLKTEQERLRREMDSLLEWRSTMLNREYEAVKLLKKEISEAEQRLAQINLNIQQLHNTSVGEIAGSMTNAEATGTVLDFFGTNKATIYTE